MLFEQWHCHDCQRDFYLDTGEFDHVWCPYCGTDVGSVQFVDLLTVRVYLAADRYDGERLQADVNAVLAEAREHAQALNDPINWGDLRCVAVYRLDDGSWLVEIEEASPDAAGFQTYIAEQLAAKGWAHVQVHTAW